MVGRCQQVGIFAVRQQANAVARYRGDLTSPTTAYLLHTPDWTNFPRARRRFFAIVRASGHSARLEKTIDSRAGARVFEVYRVS